MQNIPQDKYEQIKEAMCRPEGTLSFEYTSEELFDKKNDGGIILDIPTRGHYFKLVRDKDFKLNLYHSSPGTGTRVATIDLNTVPPAKKVFIQFSWSPLELILYINPRIENGQLYYAKGIPSEKQLRLDKNENVIEVGDIGVKTMGISVSENGKKVLNSTAIQTWQETLTAIEILETGQSDQGYIYEVVKTNLTLSMLVTGFEAYTKTRFLELEEEGILTDVDPVLDAFLSKGEREGHLAEIIKKEAIEANETVLQYMVNKDKINFQNLNQCKKAYNKAYGIKFGEIGISGPILESMHDYFIYRHKIIHRTPLLSVYNQDEVPPKAPIFPNQKFSSQAKLDFDTTIKHIHIATLSLRPKD